MIEQAIAVMAEGICASDFLIGVSIAFLVVVGGMLYIVKQPATRSNVEQRDSILRGYTTLSESEFALVEKLTENNNNKFECMACGSRYIERPCPTCFPK